MSVFLEVNQGVDVFVLSGNRQTATNLVDSSSTITVGAPTSVPVNTGAVVVAQLTKGLTSGSLQFRILVTNATPTSPFESFFSNKPVWQMYATIGAMGLVALFLIIGSLVWCCVCCSNARELKS